MIYPAKGKAEESTIFDQVTKEEIRFYKKLFGSNSSKERELFFQDDFIKKLWPFLLKHLDYKNCFKIHDHNLELEQTCGAITYELQKFMGEVPQFW